MPRSGGWSDLDELLDDVDSSSAVRMGEIVMGIKPVHLFTFLAMALSTILFGSVPKVEVSPSLQANLSYCNCSLTQDCAV